MNTRKVLPRRSRSPRATGAAAGDLPTVALVPFVALTFGLTWALLGLFIVDPWGITRWLGPASGSHPLFVLGVWTPALVALALVARQGGAAGVRRFLGRLLLWRAPLGWWLFLLVGLPIVFVGGALLRGGPAALALPDASPRELIVAAAFMLALGPVEELGWRGVALPLVQRRLAPLGAGLAVGLVWALWHIPAFVLAGTVQSGWSFTPFLVGTVAAGVLMAALVNAAGGSLLVAVLFHFQMNNPLWPDARPWDSVLLAVAAAALVALQPRALRRRESGVTQVIPRGDPPGAAP